MILIVTDQKMINRMTTHWGGVIAVIYVSNCCSEHIGDIDRAFGLLAESDKFRLFSMVDSRPELVNGLLPSIYSSEYIQTLRQNKTVAKEITVQLVDARAVGQSIIDSALSVRTQCLSLPDDQCRAVVSGMISFKKEVANTKGYSAFVVAFILDQIIVEILTNKALNALDSPKETHAWLSKLEAANEWQGAGYPVLLKSLAEEGCVAEKQVRPFYDKPPLESHFPVLKLLPSMAPLPARTAQRFQNHFVENYRTREPGICASVVVLLAIYNVCLKVLIAEALAPENIPAWNFSMEESELIKRNTKSSSATLRYLWAYNKAKETMPKVFEKPPYNKMMRTRCHRIIAVIKRMKRYRAPSLLFSAE
ncbi:MAG: hypothetical protein QGF00_28340 [Planctomycetota bacterium]|nr:hypothetical protein [Planctomycetota bacterium]MDP7253541.1 hypothetical protein [Planctomycetota bacterium]